MISGEHRVLCLDYDYFELVNTSTDVAIVSSEESCVTNDHFILQQTVDPGIVFKMTSTNVVLTENPECIFQVNIQLEPNG